MRFYFILLFSVFLSCGTATEQKNIKVACAANMFYVMDSLAIVFEEDYDIKCEITSGSSGMLTSQIENGAPYDIFISANMKYPNRLFENGRGKKPFIYAKGRLIFVVDKTKKYPNLITALEDKKNKRIGIADKKTAPYGIAANQFLENSAMLNQVSKKLIIGESVGQVNQYLITNSVNAAFTSYSFKVKSENNYQYFEVEQQYFDPIFQGIMLLNHGEEKNLEASEKLIQFFSSEKCKAVLKYFGYLAE